MIKDIVFYFYGYVVFFYSMGLIVSYVILMWLAELGIFRKKRGNLSLYTKEIIDKSPYTPGVSIIAPAYNEERTIIENVNSLLGQDYPKFEVIIVNDGSKDKTLELLIDNFQLVEVPFAYVEYIRTKPYRRLFKSTNPEYHRLIVVDKENGGTKADAVNAGLNASSYPYFVNIDVDGILVRDAISQCIIPILQDEEVIAVSGIMAVSNGCKVENGQISRPASAPQAVRPVPDVGIHALVPCRQDGLVVYQCHAQRVGRLRPFRQEGGHSRRRIHGRLVRRGHGHDNPHGGLLLRLRP